MGEPFVKSWPVKTISLDLTENCSLRCQYCFCGEKTQRDLNEETGKAAIDWLLSKETSGDEKDLQIDLWGGEPMLRWELAKALITYGNRKAKRAGKHIKWNMTTNGIHMTETICKDVALADVSFMLSIDGGKETQDKYRPLANGGSSYDLIVKHLPHMKAVYGTLRARITVREENVGNLYRDVLHLREELNIPQISHSLAHETAWEHDSIVELERQLRLIGDWYVERKRKGDEALWIKFIDDGIGRLLYPQWLSYFCGAGRGYLSISVDGVVYPCHRFHEFTDERPWQEQPFAMGTIYDGLVKSKVREMFINANANLAYCSGCNLARAGTCQGSCYAVNWVKSGKDIAIPAHSGCQEMRIVQAVAASVYNRLVGVPAFRGNLMRIAQERRRPQGCNEPGRESLYIPGPEYVEKGIRAEMEVLQSALATIQEAFVAAAEVLQNGLTERQRHLELMTQIASIGSKELNRNDRNAIIKSEDREGGEA